MGIACRCESNIVPVANESPRVCCGTIKWYMNDTFSFDFIINLTDEDGNPIELLDTDKFVVDFYNSAGDLIQSFETVGSSTITLNFTKEISTKFKKGEYFYTTKYESGSIARTIMHNNMIVVE